MKSTLMVVGLVVGMTVAGCAGTKGGAGTPVAESNAGFLADYSRLQAVEGKAGFQRYIDRSANLSAYYKLYLDQVQVFVASGAESYKGVDPQALNRISEAFRSAFIKAVSSGYQVVSVPGPDVLRVRLAITNVQPVSPPLGVRDFIPIKAVFNVGRAVAGTAPKVAEISAEFEVLDGHGRQVAAAIATRKSDKTLPQAEHITWDDLSPIVNSWARQFRQGLDDLRDVSRR